MALDNAVIVAYLLGMVAMGWWGMRRATTKSEYLVAGRRLGGPMYSGTMSAIVLGGASTVGGVGLGYKFGISGAWLVLAIGLGILLLSAAYARRIQRLRVYTVSDMLDIRYGGSSAAVSGVVMWAYALMLTVTSLGASSTIFKVLFGFDRWSSILLAGGIVVLYSVLGGMWSISMTDIVQFVVKTVGILFLLLPFALAKAGGFEGMRQRLDAAYFDFTAIGGDTIVTYLVVYTLGLLIGQDIWQRVFTARTSAVATWGGITSGVYCVIYAFAGALIGMATKALYPDLSSRDEAFATAVENLLPMGVRGLVLAAALAALMSTSSGALIASSTVAANDVWPRLVKRAAARDDVHSNRMFTLVLGVVAIVAAILIEGVVAALTVAYNLLVGGLLVAIVGGMAWKRGNRQGALASMITGAVTVVIVMCTAGLEANEVIYYGLGVSLVSYVLVSLLTPPTDAAVLDHWNSRVNGEHKEEGPA
ncbi:sodium:solute symporter [Kibdelosporangium phytohabitans]|uniref:Sodium:solute symporter n=1 Tax=Kibdelosporangium phytohabitans TaxID=860235 RepID=A0A0N7F4K2_9PSEU|nr:sodium:solute symporter [Kibdelosporangium phytohabitans]ALG11663.1 sodium:solute symporter [Kibdelosporangium phytohabitans]MBE1463050.1 SSS family solute:Na+ symporter [Kibdelosporangium phytohabitans]